MIIVHDEYLCGCHMHCRHYSPEHYDNSTTTTAVRLAYPCIGIIDNVRRATDRLTQITRGHRSNTAAMRPCSVGRKSRAQLFSHPIFVSISMDSGCSFGYALDVLGAGGRNYTDTPQQGVKIVRLVSRVLMFEQP